MKKLVTTSLKSKPVKGEEASIKPIFPRTTFNVERLKEQFDEADFKREFEGKWPVEGMDAAFDKAKASLTEFGRAASKITIDENSIRWPKKLDEETIAKLRKLGKKALKSSEGQEGMSVIPSSDWSVEVSDSSEQKVKKAMFTKKEVGDALAPYLSQIDDALGASEVTFRLTEPREVTRKYVDDTFGKIPLIGGEEISGVSAYMGKRDGMIFVFESQGLDGTIEINSADCLETLYGFEPFIDEVLGFSLRDSLKGLVEVSKEQKQKALIESNKANYGETFGSW